MQSDERRRLAIQYGIGEGDSDWPENVKRTVFAELPPLADWQSGCPAWFAGVTGLFFGQPEPLTEALDSIEPILDIYKTMLVLALRGDARLPFKLIVKGAALHGQKRAGRPRKNLRLTSEILASEIEKGILEYHENRHKIAAAVRGDGYMGFCIELKHNGKGRFPAQNGIRDILLAARMVTAIKEARKRGDSDPYHAAARLIQSQLGVRVGAETIEAAYDRCKDAAQRMLEWATVLRTELEKRGVFDKAQSDEKVA